MPQAELELEQGGCGQLFPGLAFQGVPVWGEYMNTGSHVPPTSLPRHPFPWTALHR